MALALLAWLSGSAAAETNVTFPDPNTEAAIRQTLGKPTGIVTSSHLLTLTELYAYNANITNLSGLEWATNLTTLYLGGNFISDLTVVQNLKRLNSLFLYNNLIRDLSPISGLTNLSYLDLRWNSISNYDPVLAGLHNLTTLYLAGGSITNLAFLSNFPRLTCLGLNNSEVTNLATVIALTNLSNLDLSYSPLFDRAQLGGFTNLTNLYLSGNSITNLGFVQNLTKLTSLTVYSNDVDNLSSLVELTNLSVLRLGLNRITDFVVPPSLTNLVELNLGGNSISNLAFLTNLSRLNFLSIHDNFISDVSPLSGLTYLSHLDLCWNPITNHETALAGLTNLARLYLSGNSISNLTFLANLTNLTTLSLAANHIGDVSPLLGLTNLNSLILQQNRLAGIEPLQDLPRLSYLDVRLNLLDPGTNTPTAAVVAALEGRGVAVDDRPQREPPGIILFTPTTQMNWYIAANTTALLSVRVSDNGPPNQQLNVTASSSDASLLPDANLVVAQDTNENANGWVLAVTPTADQTGTATITVTATDDVGLSTSVTLVLTVLSPQVVTFGDLNLEAAVRRSLAKPTADLTSLDLVALTYLYAYNADIANLSGLEWATSLTSLTLDNNSISNLAPLAGLTNLSYLNLSGNVITNYDAVLTGLTNLTILYLGGNSISNLAFLANLTRLTSLTLFNNLINDLSPLAGLTNLNSLYLRQNRLTDISPLIDLPQLASVDVRLNLLELSTNAPALAVIASLQGRGVTVDYLPQRTPPVVAAGTHWYIAADMTSPLSFAVSDNAAYGSQMGVAASSSAVSLVSDANLVVSQNAGPYWTLTVTPTTNQTGTTTITLTATNGAGLSTNVTVQLTVVAMTPQLVVLTDPRLEVVVRSALAKPTGALTSLDLLALTDLYAPNAGFTNLSGLEWAANLTTLDLGGNSVSNLTFLTNLTQLTSLTLFNNRINDLSPLAALTNLSSLYLRQNRITGISSLIGLPQLAYLDVRLNLLDLSTNAPTSAVIASLQGRGVTVDYQPQRAPPVVAIRTDWVIAADKTSWLPFSISDNAAYGSQIGITASSSNAGLLPPANLVAGQVTTALGINWAVIVRPITNETGTTTITLTATNEAGLITTTIILVTVAMPLALEDGLLGGTNLIWLTGGDAPWFGQSHISRDGVSAAQSGSILNGQESWVETTVNGPGILTFWWKVSSEANYDWLEFYASGVAQTNRISGVVDWRQEVVNIPPGVQTLGWRYAKDPSDGTGLDTAWLDQVSFVPLSWLDLVAAPTNGQFQLILHPVLGNLYELQASTNLVHWFPLTLVAATNTAMPYLDESAHSFARFYRLYELPAGLVWFDQPKLVGNEIHLLLHSQPGLKLEIQASTDFVSWGGLTVITNTLGTVEYTNVLTTNFPMRYFRAQTLP